jgi:hypothetical protein
MTVDRHQRLSFAVGALGVLLLLASVGLPWFGVPHAISHVPDAVTIKARDAPVTPLFKGLCVVALVASGWAARRAARSRWVAAQIAAGLFGILLLYPHAVVVWCPEIAGEAAWLRAQHASLTWGGGDVWISGEYKYFGWKDRVYVAPMPVETAVMRTPALSPEAVPFASLHDLMNWFGYSNTFCFFVSGGWGLALVGSVLLLIAVVRRQEGADMRSVLAACRVGATVFGAALALCLVPAGLCGLAIEGARNAAERGLLGVSRDRLQLAARLLPMIRQNGEVVDQIGFLDARLGKPTAEAALHEAKVLEQEGKPDQAQQAFAAVLRDHRDGAIGREAVRGLLARAIDMLNSGRATDAVAILETVLAADPCNVKANYALEAAYLRVHRLERIGELAARMRAIYKHVTAITKVTVLASAQENLADAAYLQGDALAAHLAKKKLSDPKLIRTEP